MCLQVTYEMRFRYTFLQTDSERETMFLLLSFLVFQKAPLSRVQLGDLLARDVSAILDSLTPLLMLGGPDDSVKLRHTVYADFLMKFTSDKCHFTDSVNSFMRGISCPIQNLRLASACLRFMESTLAAKKDEDKRRPTKDSLAGCLSIWTGLQHFAGFVLSSTVSALSSPVHDWGEMAASYKSSYRSQAVMIWLFG